MLCENNDLSSQLTSELDKIKKREKEIQNLKETLNEKNIENSNLQSKVHSFQRGNDENTQKIKKLENKIKSISNDYDTYQKTTETEIKSLNNNINDLNKKLKRLTNEKSAFIPTHREL